ncbi:MAG: hypothetical protein ACODAU_09145 [Myxococcota bacterium]
MSDRKQRLEAELERLQRELDSLERDWKRVPWFAALLVLTVPAGILWGAVGALLVILGTGALMGTAAYLIAVRKNEYRGEMRDVRRDIEILERRS